MEDIWEKKDALQNVIDWVREDHVSILAFKKQLDVIDGAILSINGKISSIDSKQAAFESMLSTLATDFNNRINTLEVQIENVQSKLDLVIEGIGKLLERK